MQNLKKQGFPPLFSPQSKVLILGSFPSVKSREVSFYYGNRQNRFWPLMKEIFGGDTDTVEGKKQLILCNGLALWDIVTECEIEGSSDSDIRSYRLADLAEVAERCPLEKILCNGRKSYLLTLSVYKGNLPVVPLLSTSPANVRFDSRQWKKELELYSQITGGGL